MFLNDVTKAPRGAEFAASPSSRVGLMHKPGGRDERGNYIDYFTVVHSSDVSQMMGEGWRPVAHQKSAGGLGDIGDFSGWFSHIGKQISHTISKVTKPIVKVVSKVAPVVLTGGVSLLVPKLQKKLTADVSHLLTQPIKVGAPILATGGLSLIVPGLQKKLEEKPALALLGPAGAIFAAPAVVSAIGKKPGAAAATAAGAAVVGTGIVMTTNGGSIPTGPIPVTSPDTGQTAYVPPAALQSAAQDYYSSAGASPADASQAASDVASGQTPIPDQVAAAVVAKHAGLGGMGGLFAVGALLAVGYYMSTKKKGRRR